MHICSLFFFTPRRFVPNIEDFSVLFQVVSTADGRFTENFSLFGESYFATDFLLLNFQHFSQFLTHFFVRFVKKIRPSVFWMVFFGVYCDFPLSLLVQIGAN